MQGSNEKDTLSYAGFWVRLAAWILDTLLLSVGLFLVRIIMAGVMGVLKGTFLGGNLLFSYDLKDIVIYLCGAFYFILCTYYTGTTLGKRALNLQVISVAHGGRLTFFQILYRETIGRFLAGIFVGAGYLLIGADKEKRGIHDILADTRVVYGKRIKLYPVYEMPHVKKEREEDGKVEETGF